MNWDPTKWDQDPNKWGSAGLIYNGGKDPRGLTDGRSGNGWNFDPRYVQQNQYAGSEGNGGQTYYEPTDHYNKLFDNGNSVQVRDIKRLKDQNAVKWGGDEIGWTTSKDNYTDDTDWVDKAFEYGGMALVGGIPAMHALTTGGLLGGQAGFNAAGTNGGLAGLNPGYGASLEGIGGGLGATTGHSLGGGLAADPVAAAAAGASGSAAGTAPTSAAGSGILGGGIEGLIGNLIKNPIQALGLLNMARGAFGGSNGGGSNGGSSGVNEGLFAPLPKGNRGTWTPNPVTQGQIQNFKWAGDR